MSASVFDDKSVKPDNKTFLNAIGKTAKLWQKIKSNLENEYGELIEDWKYYGQKTGWLLKVLRKKRNLFFCIPLKGCFRIAFVFGEKAVSAVESSDLPEAIKVELKNARKYAEGRGIRIEVKSSKDVENIQKLVEIKVKN
jgi:hypothetical protein